MVPPQSFDQRLEKGRIQLNPGDWLFQYTDGINEAQNPEQCEFGMERLVHALTRQSSKEPQQLVRTLLDEHEAFVDGAEQYDDMTLLAMKWNGVSADTEDWRRENVVQSR
jgi:sigma-B regulation protein RsbU (phosphoserine phosphatase)